MYLVTKDMQSSLVQYEISVFLRDKHILAHFLPEPCTIVWNEISGIVPNHIFKAIGELEKHE